MPRTSSFNKLQRHGFNVSTHAQCDNIPLLFSSPLQPPLKSSFSAETVLGPTLLSMVQRSFLPQRKKDRGKIMTKLYPSVAYIDTYTTDNLTGNDWRPSDNHWALTVGPESNATPLLIGLEPLYTEGECCRQTRLRQREIGPSLPELTVIVGN